VWPCNMPFCTLYNAKAKDQEIERLKRLLDAAEQQLMRTKRGKVG
jgi:hypothetical protein